MHTHWWNRGPHPNFWLGPSRKIRKYKDRYKYTNLLKCEITKLHIAYGKGKIEQSYYSNYLSYSYGIHVERIQLQEMTNTSIQKWWNTEFDAPCTVIYRWNREVHSNFWLGHWWWHCNGMKNDYTTEVVKWYNTNFVFVLFFPICWLFDLKWKSGVMCGFNHRAACFAEWLHISSEEWGDKLNMNVLHMYLLLTKWMLLLWLS